MNRWIVVAGLVGVAFVVNSPAFADASAEVISYGRSRAPGVKAEVMAVETGSIQARDNVANRPVGGSTAKRGLPAPVAISAHNCIPRTDARGISLGYQFVESGIGDCISFVSPEPAEPGNRRGPRPSRPDPETLAQAAYERVISLAPEPELRIAPARVGLTGLRSYFWIQTALRPITATAGVRGVTVTAEARPVRFRWDFGDGAGRTTAHPGRAWTTAGPGNVGHVYETKGPYAPGVAVVWAARWRVNHGPWQPLGYFTTEGEADYPVREMIAVLVRRR